MTPYQLRFAARVLRAGGIVAYPTEAVWGLGCDPWNAEACLRLLQLKQRPVEKGMILLAHDADQVWPLCGPLEDAQRQAVEASWPGPNTWVLPASARVPPWITGEHDSFAARVSAHPVAAALSEAAGMPIVSTSANLAGRPPATRLRQIHASFGGRVDACLPGALGEQQRPTTIRDARSGITIRH